MATKHIIPIVQPAHLPELNPLERFWQVLKRQCWQSCESLGELRQPLAAVLYAY
ncbi:MAG: hypothetical protein HC873_23100 [Leptolyngbyaceae cyanobacterium SL_1_1]|nr:hypothetical protein [Leptolyngbyaceae cyanobacterium SL_1_1]